MYQKLIIIGNLGKDPEMRYTTDGKAVTSFSVAVSERKDETMWIRVSAWNKLAEVCNQYLKKGARVLVEGRLALEPNVYERKDGTWAASYEMTASAVKFLSGNGEAEVAPDDVPF